MVGPFIFFDHLGPVAKAPDQGIDVRPHPHVGLAIVTYLFEGELFHRDSLGTEQEIRPGAVNWMTAGRGIVHSERSTDSARASGPRIHGLQLWAALPVAAERSDPSFQHHAEDTIPEFGREGARIRLIAGSAFGATSPVRTHSPLFYAEVQFAQKAAIDLPEDPQERAAYVVSGSASVDGTIYPPGRMAVFRERSPAKIEALEGSRVMLLGGARLDGERHVWWNFVSSSRETLSEAGRAWKEREFPPIPGDDKEFVPLPELRGRIR